MREPPRRGLGTAVVAGPSMVPALRHGDRLLVRWGAPAMAGRVVVARHPRQPNLLVVKRAVRREPGGWWLQGDNEQVRDDSRAFGVVPDDLVLGRVLMRCWPPRRR